MSLDYGRAGDGMSVGVLAGVYESGGHRTQLKVEKWDLDQIRWARRRLGIPAGSEPSARSFRELKVDPAETYVREDCNLITNAGWVNIMGGIAGSTPTKFVSATTGRIGLGTSATAVTAADTALGAIGALTTANWKVINATPTIGSGTGAGNGLILAATFGTTEANNVAIAEFAADLGTTSTLSTAAVGTLFSHGNATPGTKTSAQTWNVTISYQWT